MLRRSLLAVGCSSVSRRYATRDATESHTRDGLAAPTGGPYACSISFFAITDRSGAGAVPGECFVSDVEVRHAWAWSLRRSTTSASPGGISRSRSGSAQDRTTHGTHDSAAAPRLRCCVVARARRGASPRWRLLQPVPAAVRAATHRMYRPPPVHQRRGACVRAPRIPVLSWKHARSRDWHERGDSTLACFVGRE